MSYRILFAMTALAVFASTVPVSADEDAQKCTEAWERYKNADVPAAAAGMETVLMYKYRFCPAQLTVKAGTPVRFVNVDKRTSHSVWFKEKGDEESERLFPEELWQMSIDTPGTYPYLCGPHWEQQGMIGSLTVVN